MNVNFTDRARKVCQLANSEAQRFNHEYIGTEHLLLGLIKEGSGIGANVLRNLGIDTRVAREAVEALVQKGADMVTTGKLPQTPRVKKIIEYAMEEAEALQHRTVGTEHLLLGMIREEEGVAAQVLLNLGATVDTIRADTMMLLGIPSCDKMHFHFKERERNSQHSFVTIFANGANCGEVVFTPDEFGRLSDMLDAGSAAPLLNVTVDITHAKTSETRGS